MKISVIKATVMVLRVEVSIGTKVIVNDQIIEHVTHLSDDISFNKFMI